MYLLIQYIVAIYVMAFFDRREKLFMHIAAYQLIVSDMTRSINFRLT